MQEYKVTITETLTRTITVTASDKIYASKIVKDKYFDDEIILDKGDLLLIKFENL